MPFDPTNFAQIPGARFEYAKGAFLWVRPLTNTIMSALRELCTTSKMVFSQQTGKMESVEAVDKVKLEELLSDYLLEKWEGFGGEDKKPFPVTLEYKLHMLDQLDIKQFTWAVAKSLDNTEAETKNS